MLNRPYETRNNIEKLTFSVLDNTSSAILYVTDLSGFGLGVEACYELEEVYNSISYIMAIAKGCGLM